MDITKIKIKACETEIKFFENAARDTREISFSSSDGQTEDFIGCLQILLAQFMEVCDFHAGYEEGLKITGLSIKYEGDDFGLVISAIKRLKKSSTPLCINSPYIPPVRNEHTVTIMDDILIQKIEAIKEMAADFMRGGYRAQGSLFNKENKK